MFSFQLESKILIGYIKFKNNSIKLLVCTFKLIIYKIEV